MDEPKRSSESEPQAGQSNPSVSEQPKQPVALGVGKDLMGEMTLAGTAHDLSRATNQMLKDYISLPQEEIRSTINLIKTAPSQQKRNSNAEHESNIRGNNHATVFPTGCSIGRLVQDSLWPDSSISEILTDIKRTRAVKRALSFMVDAEDICTGNMSAGALYSKHKIPENGQTNIMASMSFSGICRKKRTKKVQRPNKTCSVFTPTARKEAAHATLDQTASQPKYSICCPTFHGSDSTVALSDIKEVDAGAGNRMSFAPRWADIEKLKKKRSKSPYSIQESASPGGFAGSKQITSSAGKQGAKHARKKAEISADPNFCMDALYAATLGSRTTRKRSRRTSSLSRTFKMGMQVDLVYQNSQNARKSSGPLALPWEDMILVESITTRLQQMNINEQGGTPTVAQQGALVPYNQRQPSDFNPGKNAIVLYGKDGSIIPYEGPFDPVRKRRQRAKVDLDEETNRVWKLLLENINNEGIDGTDEQKSKWWEEERRVFHGRVDSFIARMRLVQGDRRFTPWKGSVVDSVIGVFLTQNVSDHLSSSAFMSLAAHFPLKRQSNKLYEGTRVFVEEPEESRLDHDDIETCSGKILDQPACEWSSKTLHHADQGDEEVITEKELHERSPCVVIPRHDNSRCGESTPYESSRKESGINITDMGAASTSEETGSRDGTTSSQQSVVSTQASVNSPTAPAADVLGSLSESNSEAEVPTSSSNPHFGYPTSFMELLKMADAPRRHEAYSHKSRSMASFEKLSDRGPEGSKEVNGTFAAECARISDNYILHQKADVLLDGTGCTEIVDEESRSSDHPARKDDNCTTELSELTTGSTIHSPSQEKIYETIQTPEQPFVNLSSSYILEGERMIMQSQLQEADLYEISGSQFHRQKRPRQEEIATSIVTGSIRAADNDGQKQWYGHGEKNPVHDASGVTYEMTNTNTTKKKPKVIKVKKNVYDWDSLRRGAQDSGKKREKTANNMDSLDYEAVRCADVGEIADTIKERGMNNMLAERMKEFLNRLVNEHGSIDLEWLRDVDPDKAKEYLLSIRGLGLKSVECVRLLTLHHLAFPVDTNVGRIAVRLGWVPLQPLPESLQLHLLELYPVLESIQKFLWPRLCKLDQRTLYELHYHMITFGKVFCTKRQPNCNACPLRGECRHFASAFASARLALPGPEEKRIVTCNHQDQVTINPQPLIEHTANHPPETKQPIVTFNHQDQVAINPQPLIEPVANQPSETKLRITNSEPIIEVPASPELEQMQPLENDIEDAFYEDPDEIPTIKLNMEQFTQTLQTYMQASKELQPADMSNALVALTAEAASIPTPKLKNVSRLRTEHRVYELPDTHPLLDGLDKREPDDPCSYLLAIWTPGETANSIQLPERKCSCQEPGELCNDETCFYCNSQREANSQTIRGTLLIPCRTAMRGSFPLNGTYFQVNEVFADHDSSLNPIAVPREWLWNLSRRTVYFGTSIPTIMRGLTTEGIQQCFWRGYVCVRGFDQKSRAPRPLMPRLHFPASKMGKSKSPGKASTEHQQRQAG